MSGDREYVARERRLRFWIVEMNDRSIVLDKIDLLDTGDVVDGELLQSRLQLLVVGGGCLMHDLLLTSGCTWEAVERQRRH